MKTTLYKHAIVTLAIFAGWGIQPVKSQSPSLNNQSPMFSGSRLKVEMVTSEADSIFVGKMLQMGTPILAGSGTDDLCGNGVVVVQVLKGEKLPQHISISIKVKGVKEQSPDVGALYIFFARKIAHPDPDPYVAVKILLATDANIKSVKELVAATPVHN